MSALETFTSLFFVVTIAAKVLNTDSSEDSVIDDLIVDGNESLFSAFIIMKNNKETEEIILDSNERKTEPELLHDSSQQIKLRNENEGDEITPYKESIVRPGLVLRKKPWKGCLKKASKICRKACKSAIKDGCDYYDCKKKLKRRLKKECKRNCKIHFIGD